mmetsp:Transcript_35855/g.70590  ORF Transcript_35855/g.70590 Transcript_35855/m.70590 type:complete len:93 (+) Transcript_35855:463-741(+)
MEKDTGGYETPKQTSKEQMELRIKGHRWRRGDSRPWRKVTKQQSSSLNLDGPYDFEGQRSSAHIIGIERKGCMQARRPLTGKSSLLFCLVSW